MRVGVRNIKTGEKKMLGDPADVTFSYSGLLAVDGTFSPPYVTPQITVAKEIILALNTESTDDTVVDIYFDDEYKLTITLPAGETISTDGVNVPISKNMRIYTSLVSIGTGSPRDLSVLIRFGTASGGTVDDGSI